MITVFSVKTTAEGNPLKRHFNFNPNNKVTKTIKEKDNKQLNLTVHNYLPCYLYLVSSKKTYVRVTPTFCFPPHPLLY